MEVYKPEVDLSISFNEAWIIVSELGGIYIDTNGSKQIQVKASTVKSGDCKGERVLRFMKNSECSRVYAGCWGYTYNCYGVNIVNLTKALDHVLNNVPIG